MSKTILSGTKRYFQGNFLHVGKEELVEVAGLFNDLALKDVISDSKLVAHVGNHHERFCAQFEELQSDHPIVNVIPTETGTK